MPRSDSYSLPQTEAAASSPVRSPERVPLIAHVIYRFEVGGLQNGLVNLINRIPPKRYRHVVICMTDYTDFRDRIQRNDVEVCALGKRDGNDFSSYGRLYRLFRRLRPDIVHTRNLGTLEALLPALMAGVRCRVHSEHGWDLPDPNGNNRKYQWLRRLFIPIVDRYVVLSQELALYLRERVRVPAYKLTRIYNGVDTQRFRPGENECEALPAGFAGPHTLVIGTVGRMQGVKDQLTLVRAFVQLLQVLPGERARLRLVLIGDGPLRCEAQTLLQEADALGLAWFSGERNDVPALLRGLDLFVLPSTAEGISNTVLEAMASGLPVIATRVGGNPELVEDGVTGALVAPSDPAAMAQVLSDYVRNPERIKCHAQAGRKRIEERFAVDRMVEAYLAVYDSVLQQKTKGKLDELECRGHR